MDKNNIIVVNAYGMEKRVGYTYIYVGRRTSLNKCKQLCRGVVIEDYSVLGNMFDATTYGRDYCIELYKQHIDTILRGEGLEEGFDSHSSILCAINDLRRRYRLGEKLALVCWCAPKACHGDVLKQYIERE